MRDHSVAHVKVVFHNFGNVGTGNSYLCFFLDGLLDLSSREYASFFELLDGIKGELELALFEALFLS